MTDQQTPREAMKKQLFLQFGGFLAHSPHNPAQFWGMGAEEEVWLDNPEEIADAVIRHIWDRAMSDEVVEQVAASMWNDAFLKGVLAGPVRWERMRSSHAGYNMMDTYRLEAKAAIIALLTAVIGPRPQGENDE